MYYYKINEKFCFSIESIGYEQISKEAFEKAENNIYFLNKMLHGHSKNSMLIQDVKELAISREMIEYVSLKYLEKPADVSEFIEGKINSGKVVMINPAYGLDFNEEKPGKKNVTILGLGDVGGTLLLGLRLLGKDVIQEIRLFDLDEDKVKRYILEMNQIVYPSDSDLPKVVSTTKEDLFNTDVFIFTASKFVPQVGNEEKDVRMVQYEANKEIIKIYAKMARTSNFEGLFAVISDPVDLLCNVVFYESNKNKQETLDFKGLLPNQVRGFGLGVMNGRANYYSKIRGLNYKNGGRVFGPHGKGLIVANSIKNYSQKESLALTEDVITANLKVRATGFKPYIAPALSSGALSILETLRGNFNYSTVFIDGIYWGIRNRLINGSVGIERSDLNDELMKRIKTSYDELRHQYEKN
jgi:malate/lactate dehydrogenase